MLSGFESVGPHWAGFFSASLIAGSSPLNMRSPVSSSVVAPFCSAAILAAFLKEQPFASERSGSRGASKRGQGANGRALSNFRLARYPPAIGSRLQVELPTYHNGNSALGL